MVDGRQTVSPALAGPKRAAFEVEDQGSEDI